MGLVKLGAGVVQISGSISGMVFARNRGGNYIRPRTKPVNPKSSRQMAARLSIIELSEQWRESPMTPTIRGAWDTYAASVNWNNALGESIKLTGFMHFVRSNCRRIAAGLTIITAAPTALELPGADTAFAVAGAVDDQKLSITFTAAAPWASEVGGALIVEMGRPQPASRTFFGGPFRTAGSIKGAAIPPTPPQELTAPFTLVLGQKVWCRGSVIRLDGRCSTLFGAVPFLVTAS